VALYNLRCSCGNTKRVFGDSYNKIATDINQMTCTKCFQLMQREVNGPSTRILEKLDNGSMVKSLERYADAERVFQDRHDNADELAGTKPNRS
jgi:hypothetical protein